jgi:ferredoxin-NADP reductase/ferredoxin
MAASVTINDSTFPAEAGETVLDVLLRNEQAVSYSCKAGTCHTCVVQAQAGTLSAAATTPLSSEHQQAGRFLACQCEVVDEVVLGPPVRAWHAVHVVRLDRLSDCVCRVVIENPGFSYHPGQYVQLRRADGLQRSYSIASGPESSELELHVGRVDDGAFSNWVHDDLSAGDALAVCEPDGECYYSETTAIDAPLLLVGTGTGLAPLLGIARSALSQGHQGPIQLLHGGRNHDRLYLQDELRELAERHANFHYLPCLKEAPESGDHHAGDLESAMATQVPSAAGFNVFLCGNPLMITKIRTAAFLAGADFQDIRCDAFTLTEK